MSCFYMHSSEVWTITSGTASAGGYPWTSIGYNQNNALCYGGWLGDIDYGYFRYIYTASPILQEIILTGCQLIITVTVHTIILFGGDLLHQTQRLLLYLFHPSPAGGTNRLMSTQYNQNITFLYDRGEGSINPANLYFGLTASPIHQKFSF